MDIGVLVYNLRPLARNCWSYFSKGEEETSSSSWADSILPRHSLPRKRSISMRHSVTGDAPTKGFCRDHRPIRQMMKTQSDISTSQTMHTIKFTSGWGMNAEIECLFVCLFISLSLSVSLCLCLCVYVCACVRACVRARARGRVYVCVWRPICQRYRISISIVRRTLRNSDSRYSPSVHALNRNAFFFLFFFLSPIWQTQWWQNRWKEITHKASQNWAFSTNSILHIKRDYIFFKEHNEWQNRWTETVHQPPQKSCFKQWLHHARWTEIYL